jgi:hypothetical protein
MGSRVELYAAIRFDWVRNQMSIRALADKYGVHRRTVREAVESPVPPPRRDPVRPSPVLDTVREVIDGMLAEDLAAPRKSATPPGGSSNGSATSKTRGCPTPTYLLRGIRWRVGSSPTVTMTTN